MTARRFLLGIANEAEICSVEDAILNGKLGAPSLADSEDELIDEYCLGRLSAEEQRGYLENFLISEERMQRHAFSVALVAYAQKHPVQDAQKPTHSRDHIPVPFWKLAAGFAAAACVLVTAWASYDHARLRKDEQLVAGLRHEVSQARSKLDRGGNGAALPNEQVLLSVRDQKAGTDQIPTLDFSSSTRSVYPALVHISADVKFVRIEVHVTNPVPGKYREIVLSQNGEQIWTQEFSATIACISGSCTSALPAIALPAGVYHFKF